jgi:hypothetical protein
VTTAPRPATAPPTTAAKVRAWAAAHRKLIVAVAGAALTVALQVWGPGNPYVSLAVLAASSLGVYAAPNRPPPPP